MEKPSEMIRSHISGTGSGFELDDLMTRRTGGIYDQILKRLVDIHRRFRTPEYRIGTSNPASFDELEGFAAELEKQGH
jgi:hypothetical protein